MMDDRSSSSVPINHIDFNFFDQKRSKVQE